MNVLVTGGAGFIGSNYIIRTMKKHYDYNICCLDKLTYAGRLQNLKMLNSTPRFKFIKGDIANVEDVETLFESMEFDAVVNFAAETHVDRSIKSPDDFIRSNVVGVQVLLETCKKYGVRRFHQVSTDEVYGDIGNKKVSFKEDYRLMPSSPYAASKAAADLLVLSYKKTFDMNVTISRCTNNFGEHQVPEKLIPKTIMRALHNMPIPIYGDGTNVREWIHVYDHCEAIDKILHEGKSGEIYNIGSGVLYSNIEIVRMIIQELKKDESLITFVDDRPGHDYGYSVDCEKIRRELNWKPNVDFYSGLKQTIHWYINCKTWDVFE